MSSSKWSVFDEQILATIKDPNNIGLGYTKLAKKILGEDAEYKDIDLFRTYIRRTHGEHKPIEVEEESSFSDGENYGINQVMQEKGISSGTWKSAWVKANGISVLVKNTEIVGVNGAVSVDKIREEFKSDLENHSPTFPTLDRTPVEDPHLLIIDVADLHIGKLAATSETGEVYNVEVAKAKAIEGVEGILKKTSGFNIDKILFVIGNDILHTDNAKSSTTKGTHQNTDGMWYDNFKIARELYCYIIEGLLSVADVHVVHNPSNHDFLLGFAIADSVESWFKNSTNVTFDVSNAHRKYFKYGKSLISTSHGDGAKMDKLPLLMAQEEKQLWADTEFRYIYLHHLHHKQQYKFQSAADYMGVTVEFLRSPSGTDSWHHINGYQHAVKAVEGFIHAKDSGQVARISHIFS